LKITDIDNNFLNRNPIAQETIARTDKLDCIKLKSFCTTKEIIARVKKKTAYRIGENLCQLFI
jgi:hypothetical protein